MAKTPKKGEYVKFKNIERKIKSPFMIYVDFESILGPEDNGKQNPSESYTNKYQKYVACSYGYKLVCVDDKFSKPFISYLGKMLFTILLAVWLKKVTIVAMRWKKYFNKELVMIKKDDEDFENCTKCWICDNDYIDGDVKVRYHCHITGKYRGSPHRHCNIKLN